MRIGTKNTSWQMEQKNIYRKLPKLTTKKKKWRIKKKVGAANKTTKNTYRTDDDDQKYIFELKTEKKNNSLIHAHAQCRTDRQIYSRKRKVLNLIRDEFVFPFVMVYADAVWAASSSPSSSLTFHCSLLLLLFALFFPAFSRNRPNFFRRVVCVLLPGCWYIYLRCLFGRKTRYANASGWDKWWCRM